MKEQRELMRKNIDDAKRRNQPYEYYKRSHEDLSLHYLLKEAEFKVEVKDVDIYVEDYIKRDIETAANYIGAALEKDFARTDDKLQRAIMVSEIESEKIEKLQAALMPIISQVRDNYLVNNMTQMERYLATESEGGIAYKSEYGCIWRYISDWLNGIETAKPFVIKAISENSKYVFQIYLSQTSRDLSPKSFCLTNLLLALIKEHNPKMVKMFELEKAVRLSWQQRNKFGALLQEAQQANILEDFMTFNDISTWIVHQKVLPDITTIATVTVIYDRLDLKQQAEVDEQFFIAAILSDNVIAVPFFQLKASSQKQSAIMENYSFLGTSEKYYRMRLKDDIDIDYKLASIAKDVNACLEIAHGKNKKQFEKLFYNELVAIKKEFDVSRWPINNFSRADFYRQLMIHPDMQQLTNYKKCLQLVNSIFTKLKLQLIAEPPKTNILSKQISRANVERADDFQGLDGPRQPNAIKAQSTAEEKVTISAPVLKERNFFMADSDSDDQCYQWSGPGFFANTSNVKELLPIEDINAEVDEQNNNLALIIEVMTKSSLGNN